MKENEIYQGNALDVLKTFPNKSIDCVITSPPYWALRKYGDDSNELGQEKTFQEYVIKLIEIFDEVKRVLKSEGTCWVNLSDTYAGNKIGKTDNKVSDYLKKESSGINKKSQSVQNKSLCNVPHRFAIAMTDRGWIQRNCIIWYKRNAMPSSVTDRFTVDYEPIFFFTKVKKYYFEQQFEKSIWYEKDKRALTGGITKSGKSITEQGNQYSINKSGSFNKNSGYRNCRSVWDIPTKASNVSHFAMYPEVLVERMIKAGCPKNGIVLDLFAGAGNTLTIAKKLGRKFIGIELYEKYIEIMKQRLAQQTIML